MNVMCARKIIKQYSPTVRRIQNSLDAGPVTVDFVYSTLRKQGSVIAEYISALLVTGKITTTRDGVYSTGLSLKDSQEIPRSSAPKLAEVWREKYRA